MSHFIHGILSNILILPLLHTLLILKELMFDVCGGYGGVLVYAQMSLEAREQTQVLPNFSFPSWDWIFHWLEIQQVDQASIC